MIDIGSKPNGFVRLTHKITLGQPEEFKLSASHTREWFRPRFLVINIPMPIMVILNGLYCNGDLANQLVERIDGYMFSPLMQNTFLVLPTIEENGIITCDFSYTGCLPSGFIKGKEFEVITMICEGTFTHCQNITKEVGNYG